MISKLLSNKAVRKLLSPVIRLRHYKLFAKENFYNELFSNVIKGTLIVKVKNIQGFFEFDFRSDILKRILRDKEYEPSIVQVINKYLNLNKDVVNVGANVGLYVNHIANNDNFKKRILAIEPTPNAFKLLNSNCLLNSNLDKVILFNGVASDSNSNFELNIVEGKEEYSSLGQIVYGFDENQIITKIEIPGRTLDSLVTDNDLNPGLLIIDVEGAEYKVLIGSMVVLKKFRPIIISEIVDEYLNQQGDSSIAIFNLLKEINYKVINVDSSVNSNGFSGNIIAIPVEIFDTFQ
jgi:FkbM family methyltransferase